MRRLKALRLTRDRVVAVAVIAAGLLIATSFVYALKLVGTPFVPVFWYSYLPIIGLTTYRYGLRAGTGVAALCTVLLLPIAVPQVADSGLSLETLAVLSTFALFVLAAFMTSYLLALQHDLERKASDLSVLLSGVTSFSSTLNVEEVLESFAAKLATCLDSTFCYVALSDRSGGPIVVRVRYPPQERRETDIECDRMIASASSPRYRHLLDAGESLLLQGEDTSDFLQIDSSARNRPAMEWIILHPLVVGRRSLGIAVAGRDKPSRTGRTTETQVELSRALCAAAASALENATLFEMVSEEKEKTEHILDAMTDGVFTTDAECRLLSANGAALRAMGIEADGAIGRLLCDLSSPADDEGASLCGEACPIRTAAKNRRSVWCGPVRWTVGMRRRRTIQIAWAVAPLAGESGTVAGAVSVVRDVSREEELSRLKSEFISMVSHELRSPLTNIGAAIELMQSGDTDESRRREMLDMVRSEVMRLGKFVEEILDAERLDKGEMPLQLEPVSLLPVVRRVVATFKSQPNGHSFRVTGPRSLPFVLADASKVERVLSNLVDNAVSYSPPRSTITIEMRPQPDSAAVTVIDYGVGIPADRLDRVFDRYYRAHTGDSQAVYGYGLGLYTCKMLIEAQGGQIWVESKEGRGSRFTFTLPLCETTA